MGSEGEGWRELRSHVPTLDPNWSVCAIGVSKLNHRRLGFVILFTSVSPMSLLTKGPRRLRRVLHCRYRSDRSKTDTWTSTDWERGRTKSSKGVQRHLVHEKSVKEKPNWSQPKTTILTTVNVLYSSYRDGI